MTTAREVIIEANKYLGAIKGGILHRDIVNIYNSHKPLARGYELKYSDDWCDGFVSAIAIKCKCTDIIGTEVGVPKHLDIFKQKGIWLGKTQKPKQGDIFIITYSNGGADHIGFVQYTENDGRWVHTTEGNYIENGVSKCKTRSFAWDDSRVLGYARPRYQEDTRKSYDKELPNIEPLKKGSSGTNVKMLQEFLKWTGAYSGTIDGSFGSVTEEAVKKFQKWVGLWADGIFGPKTIAEAKKYKK